MAIARPAAGRTVPARYQDRVLPAPARMPPVMPAVMRSGRRRTHSGVRMVGKDNCTQRVRSLAPDGGRYWATLPHEHVRGPMNNNDVPMTPAMLAWMLEDLIEEARGRRMSDETIATVLDAATAALRQERS
jgi:hypothetical protein